jgi:hypothetical protein
MHRRISPERPSISHPRYCRGKGPPFGAISTASASCSITSSQACIRCRHGPCARFAERTSTARRTAVQTARPDVPPKLARVIERAIDHRAEHRYQSAEALAADLAALQPRPRFVRLAYAAGVVAVFILVVGVGWEMAARQMGSSSTPSALLAGFAGLNPVGAVDVSPAERIIIAVLPLKNLSAEPGSDYFTDGLTDEIIRNLALIEGMEVRSRTSSFVFKDKPRNFETLARGSA